MVKNPNSREKDHLAIYKHDRGVELTRVYRETTPAKWSERDLSLQPSDFKSGALTTRRRYVLPPFGPTLLTNLKHFI